MQFLFAMDLSLCAHLISTFRVYVLFYVLDDIQNRPFGSFLFKYYTFEWCSLF